MAGTFYSKELLGFLVADFLICYLPIMMEVSEYNVLYVHVLR